MAFYGVAAGQATQLQSKQDPPGFLGGGLLIPREQFTREFLTDYFRDLLSRENEPLISIWIFTNDMDAMDFWSGNIRADHIPFDVWKADYGHIRDRHIPVAQFLSIKGAGLLSIRDEKGTVQVIPLGRPGADASWMEDGRSQILGVNVVWEQTKPARKHAVFFLKTSDPLSNETGLKLMERFTDLPFDEIYIQVRNDFWFIDAPEFPAYYPFENGAQVPSHEAYWNSSMLVCSRGFNPARCAVFTRSGFDPSK